MQKLQGIAVSPGVAIGEALVMDNEGFRIPRRFVARDAVEDELERLAEAIDAAGAEIERNRQAVARELGEQYAADLLGPPANAARSRACAASWKP